MRVVSAPDSFKGSLSAKEAAEAVMRGLHRVWPQAEYVLFPIADGGEGTVATLVDLTGGVLCEEDVVDSFLRPIRAAWGLLGDGRVAVVETAAAAGLAALAPHERDPLKASSFGTGQLIIKALARPGVEKLIVGLGGSSTNDAGAGLLSALGARFLDRAGRELPPGGAALAELAGIDLSGLHPGLGRVEIVVASDVTNPLTGPDGASHTFGPQKGADDKMVALLDGALANFARVARAQTGREADTRPGAGAAGGLGAAFLFFTDAVFKSGVRVVLEEGGFRKKAAGAALIVTGEGQSDWQTAWGKAPVGVAEAGRELGAPVVLLSGSLGRGYEELYSHGIGGLASLAPGPLSLEKAMAEAGPLLTAAAERLGRLLNLNIDCR